MIKTQVIGHLGKDAMVNTINGRTVINFSVAHSEQYTDKEGQKKSNTIWVNCSYWIDRTKIAEYLKRGTQVYVDGTPSIDAYRNEQGITIPQLRLRVDSVQLLGGGEKKQDQPQSQPVQTNNFPDTGDVVDDLPF